MEWKKNKKDRYKPHACPRCGVVHTKQGPYCSRSCGNVREMTEVHVAKITQSNIATAIQPRESLREKDNELSEYGRLLDINRYVKPDEVRLRLDDMYMGIFTPPPIGDNQFVEDGDIWTENS
jgi:hypothetical protein